MGSREVHEHTASCRTRSGDFKNFFYFFLLSGEKSEVSSCRPSLFALHSSRSQISTFYLLHCSSLLLHLKRWGGAMRWGLLAAAAGRVAGLGMARGPALLGGRARLSLFAHVRAPAPRPPLSPLLSGHASALLRGPSGLSSVLLGPSALWGRSGGALGLAGARRHMATRRGKRDPSIKLRFKRSMCVMHVERAEG